jgi:hypothetical protein
MRVRQDGFCFDINIICYRIFQPIVVVVPAVASVVVPVVAIAAVVVAGVCSL